MKPSSILDLEDIADAVSYTFGVESIMYARQELLGMNKWFYKNGLAVQFQILGNHKCTVHLFGVSRDKLKDTRDFVVSCALWIVDNTPMTCILVFCKEEDLKLRFLIQATGAKEGSMILDANGVGHNEILYTYRKEERDLYEGRLTCHK